MLQGVVTRVSQPEPGAGGYPTATIQMTDIMERGRTKVAPFLCRMYHFPASALLSRGSCPTVWCAHRSEK